MSVWIVSKFTLCWRFDACLNELCQVVHRLRLFGELAGEFFNLLGAHERVQAGPVHYLEARQQINRRANWCGQTSCCQGESHACVLAASSGREVVAKLTKEETARRLQRSRILGREGGDTLTVSVSVQPFLNLSVTLTT